MSGKRQFLEGAIHSRNELITYITKEDAIFRAFLSHLHDFEGESMADITRGTEPVSYTHLLRCSQTVFRETTWTYCRILCH